MPTWCPVKGVGAEIAAQRHLTAVATPVAVFPVVAPPCVHIVRSHRPAVGKTEFDSDIRNEKRIIQKIGFEGHPRLPHCTYGRFGSRFGDKRGFRAFPDSGRQHRIPFRASSAGSDADASASTSSVTASSAAADRSDRRHESAGAAQADAHCRNRFQRNARERGGGNCGPPLTTARMSARRRAGKASLYRWLYGIPP